MKLIRKYEFSPSITPIKNDMLKIQIIDERYWAADICGYFDDRLHKFYYISMCGDCLCREYIDPLSIVSWEYK